MLVKEKTIYLSIVEILLLCAAMNFKAKFFYFAFSVLIVVSIFNKTIKVDYTAWIYIFLGGVMAFYSRTDGIMAMIRCFAYVSCYIAGYNLLALGKNQMLDDEKTLIIQEYRIKKFITMLAFGSFMHLMLNWYMNRGLNIGRNLPDIWSGQVLSATSQAAIGCLMVGYSSSLILCPIKKMERLMGTVFAGLLLGYNMILSGRTLVMMYILILLGGFFFLFLYDKKKERLRKVIVWIILLTIGFVIIFMNNIGGIQDTIVSSNLYQRFFGREVELDILESNRTNQKMGHLKNIIKYPFGGLHSREKYGYAHDLLLDAHDEYGIIVLLLLIILLVVAIYNIYLVVRNEHYTIEIKMMIVAIYCSIFIQFCLEPIFAGMPWLFVCFCFINGCVVGQNRNVKIYSCKSKL